MRGEDDDEETTIATRVTCCLTSGAGRATEIADAASTSAGPSTRRGDARATRWPALGSPHAPSDDSRESSSTAGTTRIRAVARPRDGAVQAPKENPLASSPPPDDESPEFEAAREPVRRRPSGKREDPFATDSGLERLKEMLRRQVRHFGHGHTRIPQDVINKAYDETVDVYLRASKRDEMDWVAIATFRLWNLVRSGPDRLELDRDRMIPIPATDLPAPNPGENPRETFEQLAEVFLTCLTELERNCITAYCITAGIEAAARLLGLPSGQVWITVKRAIAKLRREFG